jgi:hypothetical protein
MGGVFMKKNPFYVTNGYWKQRINAAFQAAAGVVVVPMVDIIWMFRP